MYLMIHNIRVSSEACVCPASQSNDYDCDCLAFALLSHGEDEGMIHGTDTVIAIDSLMAPLKHAPNMTHFAGKPKLVFVQVAVLFQHYVRIFCIYLSKNSFEDYLGEKQCQGMTVEKKVFGLIQNTGISIADVTVSGRLLFQARYTPATKLNSTRSTFLKDDKVNRVALAPYTLATKSNVSATILKLHEY